MRRYLLNLLTALSQLVNVAVLNGDPDESVSRRAARNQHVPFWRVVGLVLERVHPGHLAWALRSDDDDRPPA